MMALTREETIKLLALIKVAYPSAYRDMDNASKHATVAMWHRSFGAVPYAIMELAFERYRATNRFAPSVSEISEVIRDIHYSAWFDVNARRGIGDEDMQMRGQRIFDATLAFVQALPEGGGDMPLLTEKT